jgi:transcriptional regulator with XRE-family HTH domain
MYFRRIKDLREDKDLLQKDIAKLLNTTQQHYSRIEKGLTEITADRIVKLAIFYNVSADYILELSNKKERKDI